VEEVKPGTANGAFLRDVLLLLDELLCRVEPAEQEPDYLFEAIALLQATLCGTADPAFVRQRLEELTG